MSPLNSIFDKLFKENGSVDGSAVGVFTHVSDIGLVGDNILTGLFRERKSPECLIGLSLEKLVSEVVAVGEET